MSESTKNDLVYLAGIFDVKGMMLPKHRRARLRIESVDARLLQMFVDRFGGHIVKHIRRRGSYWQLCGKAAQEAVRTLRPHLYLRADEADHFLAITPSPNGRPRKRISPLRVPKALDIPVFTETPALQPHRKIAGLPQVNHWAPLPETDLSALVAARNPRVVAVEDGGRA